jgi:transcriptional regulator GlxA family with amidase domain
MLPRAEVVSASSPRGSKEILLGKERDRQDAFHKAVTAMSPLQFHKELRLQEARRLLLAGDADAATAGFRVGYEDPSHFSREYKRLFGQPPVRDVERLCGAAANRPAPVASVSRAV